MSDYFDNLMSKFDSIEKSTSVDAAPIDASEIKEPKPEKTPIADFCFTIEELKNLLTTGEKLSVPKGKKAILLNVCTGNNDNIGDYLKKHNPVISVLLGIADDKNSLSFSLNSIIEKYPELSKLKWSHHTDYLKNSERNYMRTEPIGKFKQEHGEVDYWYELNSFYGNPENESFNLYSNYERQTIHTKNALLTRKDNLDPIYESQTVSYYRNLDKNGIEIHFPDKPNEAVLELLNESKFKYHRFKKFWYGANSITNLNVAESLKSLILERH